MSKVQSPALGERKEKMKFRIQEFAGKIYFDLIQGEWGDVEILVLGKRGIERALVYGKINFPIHNHYIINED